MPRLFLGNFDFEHRLADPVRKLPAKLDRINAELATSWLAIADDGDYLWTPEPIDASFFEQAVADGLPSVIPIVSLDQVPRGVTCEPWGWTDDIRRMCDRNGWVRHDPPDSAVRAANSRRLSTALEHEWLVGLDFSGEARSLPEIERFIAFHEPDSPWVIKAEFGMSARERLIGAGRLTTEQCNWIAKRLKKDGVVFFEPWVHRLEEAGMQIQIPAQGAPQLIGVAPMYVSAQGQYAGSLIRPAIVESAERQRSNWDPANVMVAEAVDVALRTASRAQELGYFGPMGIDCMRYQGADGVVRLRPLQDINARWTMGRLSLHWRRLLKPHESAYWSFATTSQFDGNLVHITTESDGRECYREVNPNCRLIPTSPGIIGESAPTHRSVLWVNL